MIGDGERELEPAPKKGVVHNVENLSCSEGWATNNQGNLPIMGAGNHAK